MTVLLDAAGRRRSPVTMPGYHAGRPPGNKGMRYPADPPTVDEIVAVMRHTGDDRHGWRLRAMIIVLWRAGLRLQEALALAEHDLDRRQGSILVRRGKGGRRREVGMDEWGWEHLHHWLTARAELPVGPLFCIIDGRTRGRAWSAAAVRRSSAALRREQECGVGSRRPRPERTTSRHGLRRSHVVLGGREVAARRPRARSAGRAAVTVSALANARSPPRRRRAPRCARPSPPCPCGAPC
jgi:integrase